MGDSFNGIKKKNNHISKWFNSYTLNQYIIILCFSETAKFSQPIEYKNSILKSLKYKPGVLH